MKALPCIESILRLEICNMLIIGTHYIVNQIEGNAYE
jgi:hypothetical protein